MLEETSLWFGPFRLDVANESVWHGQEALKLTRKALAVLCYLVEHAGQLVTKEDLFQAIWPEVVVGDAALTVCIRELRQVLGDDAKAPQYIETVYGRGYRFIAAVTAAPVSSSELRVPSSPLPPAPTLVGREAELEQLRGWPEKAAHGQRQIVFVTGEPGIGKTTVVEAFLTGLRDRGTGIGVQGSGNKRERLQSNRPLTPDPCPPFPGSVADSASSSTGQGKVTYLSSRPSSISAVSQATSGSCLCSANMRQCGWHSYPRF